MLVVVADDQPAMLTFVKRWFNDKYRNDKEMRIETCNRLDQLESFVLDTIDKDKPFLILVDLNWHGNRIKTLKTIGRIKRSRTSRCWPILVYSESDDEKDIFDAHYHHANGYVLKGEDQKQVFIQVIEHWRERQKFPLEHH